MDAGPEIPKRVLGAPPSDLPEAPLTYPGTPLSHRFSPVEQVRKVEELKTASQERLASSVPFKPIVSISYPDKNVHLAPVTNVRARSLQPVALSGRVLLPAGGAGIFELSEDLRGPLETRVGQAINKPVEAGAQTTVNTLFAKTAPSSAPSLETTHTELEKVKEFARRELARRGGLVQRPQISTTPETISTQPVGQITTVDQTRQSPLPEAPPTPIIPPAESDDETRRILSEASELETQLAELSNVIASQPKEADISINPVPNAPIPATPTIDEHNDQINRLVTDKTSLLRQLNEMTASYNQGGQEKQSLETKLKTITDDYERRLQQAQIEKTNLLAQFKNLEEKMTEISGKQTENESTLNNVSELKARLSAVEKERNEVADRAQKLEALVNALQSVPKTVAEPPKTVVAPTQAEPGRETPSSARIVSAQIATGKMAPSLTTTPNVINGVTKDTGGLLLYNVIIVVKDATGQPVRALKTNKIGQFAISTPLPNDTYTMELESPGHTFDIVQIELDGKVLPPIEIRATS